MRTRIIGPGGPKLRVDFALPFQNDAVRFNQTDQNRVVCDTVEKAPWLQSLERRAHLIKAWRAELQTLERLAADSYYIRVGVAGYRLVSLDPVNPCGRIIRKGSGTRIRTVSSMTTALASVQAAEPAAFYNPGNAKSEHRMQAAMIRHALMNGLALHGLTNGFCDVFDELLFVTDELKAGDIRADIIALGGKQGRYFPVFVELKAIRALNLVKQQLDNARTAMRRAQAGFVALLANATGKSEADIRFDGARMLIVWPHLPSGKERTVVAAARASGYLIANYDPHTQRIVRSNTQPT